MTTSKKAAAAISPALNVAALDAAPKAWNLSGAPEMVVGAVHRGTIVCRRAFGIASVDRRNSIIPLP